MKSKINNYWKTAVFAILLAAWVSIPAWTLTQTSAAGGSSIERSARLTSPNGGANPQGWAYWELENDGRSRIEVDVVNFNLPAGTALQVVVDNAVIGQAFVDSFFHVWFRLRTQDGQPVPSVNVGSTAQLLNGTTVLVSGVFIAGGTPSPSPSQSGTGSILRLRSQAREPELLRLHSQARAQERLHLHSPERRLEPILQRLHRRSRGREHLHLRRHSQELEQVLLLRRNQERRQEQTLQRLHRHSQARERALLRRHSRAQERERRRLRSPEQERLHLRRRRSWCERQY